MLKKLVPALAALAAGVYAPHAYADPAGQGGAVEIAFFGSDDVSIGKDRRLIDDLNASDFALGDIAGPMPGRELARRETGGPNRVLVPLPKAKKFAEDVMRRILQGAGITGFEPKVEIVSDGAITAAAYPDGTVLVTLGTLRNLKTADELAAILAHEFSHVLLKHHSSDWFMDAQNRGLAVYKLLLDVKSMLEKLDGSNEQDNQFKDLKNRLIAEAVVTASEILVDAPFDKHQEDQADLLGTDLLIKANYNPDGMIEMLKKLEVQEEQDAKALEEAKQLRRKNISLSQDIGLFSSLAGAFGEIAMDVKSEVLAQFTKDHRPAADRRSVVTGYLDTHYTDPMFVPLSTAPWEAMVADPDVKGVLDGYRAALNARRALSTYSMDEAAKQSRMALDALGPEHALPRKIAAEISFTVGDYDRAARLLTEGANAYEPSISVYQGLSEAQIKTGNPQAALETIGYAATEFSDAPQLLPSKIAALGWRGGNQNKNAGKFEVAGLTAQCRIEAVDGLDKLCEEAARGEFSVFRIRLPAGMKPGKVDPGTASASVSLKKPTRSNAKVSGYVQVKEQGGVNARRGPGTGNPVVASFGYRAKLGVIGSAKSPKGRDWLHVRDGSGQEGWVAGWLTVPDGSLKAEAVAAPAPAAAPASVQNASSAPDQKQPETAAAPAAAAATPDPESVESRLKKAKELFDNGILNEEEYAAARKRILQDL